MTTDKLAGVNWRPQRVRFLTHTGEIQTAFVVRGYGADDLLDRMMRALGEDLMAQESIVGGAHRIDVGDLRAPAGTHGYSGRQKR